MKKIFISFLTLSFILTSCNNSSKQTQPLSQNTKMYSSVIGDVEIPSNPTRIVSDFYIGEFLTLGITPVGIDLTPYPERINPLWEDLLDETTNIGNSLEQIIELNPDLIITIFEDKYENYSKIAPTILIPFGKYPVRELLSELGKITNRELAANEWIDSFNKKVEQAKSDIKPFITDNSTFTTMEVWDNTIFIYGDNWGRAGSILYNELLLQAPPKAQEEIIGKPQSFKSVSLEVIPDYIGNTVLFVKKDPNMVTELENSNIWKNLDAVTSNKIFELPSDIYYQSDPVSLEYQLQDIVNIITGKFN